VPTLITGLSEQYSRARNWVATKLHFNKNYQASVFETTIRIVGGLVAAYDLSGWGGYSCCIQFTVAT
jgi:hypothetical protein